MIIRPIDGFREIYQTFNERDQDSIDILISNMLTNALILKSISVGLQDHYMQLPFQNGSILQFIVDVDNDALVVMFYNGIPA